VQTTSGFFGDKITKILQEILKPGLGHPCVQAVQMASREAIKGSTKKTQLETDTFSHSNPEWGLHMAHKPALPNHVPNNR